MHFVAMVDLVWAWTPLIRETLLEPGTTFQVNLTATGGDQKNFPVVLLFNAKQREQILPELAQGNSYVTSLWRATLETPVNATFTTWSEEVQTLGVLQAVQAMPPMHVTGHVSFKGVSRHHLAPEDQVIMSSARVILVACVMSILMLLAGVFARKNWRNRLHVVFFVCFLLKAMVLLFFVMDLSLIDATGEESVLRAASCQMLKHLQDTCIMGLFFLIGLGWKITRSKLRNSEWTFVVVAMSVSMLLRGMEILCAVFNACSPTRYLLTVFTVNALCSLVIIVATNFNMFILGRQLLDSHVTQEVGIVYAKFQAYMKFRICYLYFVMVPAICSGALRLISVPTMRMVKELLEWVLLCAILWLWRPGYVDEIRVFNLADPAEAHSSEESLDEAMTS